MPVKIRLTRMGKKKQPSYRVVVMDSRQPRDGKYIEQIGRYDPRQEPSVVEIDQDRANLWLERGAQPTERVRKLLEVSGAMTQHKVATGAIHTVGEDAQVEAAKEEAERPAPVAGGEIHVVGADALEDETEAVEDDEGDVAAGGDVAADGDVAGDEDAAADETEEAS